MGTQDVRKTILSLCGGLALAAATQPIAAGNVDEKLLAMLKANGSITEAQYTELSADLVAEQREEAHDSSAIKQDISALDQKVSWAQRTVISGDIRVRQERIQVEDQKPAEQTQSRQRYRARIGRRLAGHSDGRSRHSSRVRQQQRRAFDQPGHEQLFHQEGHLARPRLHQLASGERAGTEDVSAAACRSRGPRSPSRK